MGTSTRRILEALFGGQRSAGAVPAGHPPRGASPRHPGHLSLWELVHISHIGHVPGACCPVQTCSRLQPSAHHHEKGTGMGALHSTGGTDTHQGHPTLATIPSRPLSWVPILPQSCNDGQEPVLLLCFHVLFVLSGTISLFPLLLSTLCALCPPNLPPAVHRLFTSPQDAPTFINEWLKGKHQQQNNNNNKVLYFSDQEEKRIQREKVLTWTPKVLQTNWSDLHESLPTASQVPA